MFIRTRQLLPNDEFLKNDFMIFNKQDNKVITEVPMNDELKDINSKQPEQTSGDNSFADLYRILHSSV